MLGVQTLRPSSARCQREGSAGLAVCGTNLNVGKRAQLLIKADVQSKPQGVSRAAERSLRSAHARQATVPDGEGAKTSRAEGKLNDLADGPGASETDHGEIDGNTRHITHTFHSQKEGNLKLEQRAGNPQKRRPSHQGKRDRSRDGRRQTGTRKKGEKEQMEKEEEEREQERQRETNSEDERITEGKAEPSRSPGDGLPGKAFADARNTWRVRAFPLRRVGATRVAAVRWRGVLENDVADRVLAQKAVPTCARKSVVSPLVEEIAQGAQRSRRRRSTRRRTLGKCASTELAGAVAKWRGASGAGRSEEAAAHSIIPDRLFWLRGRDSP